MVKQWEAESIAIQRNKARLLRRRMWRRRIYSCALVCVLAYGGLLGWWLHRSGELAQISQGLQARAERFVMGSGLTLRTLRIEGHETLTPEQVVEQAAIETDVPIFALSLQAIRTRLEAHPQIASAQLVRELPGRIEITITERKPAALWQRKEGMVWLDKDGVMLDSVPEGTRQMQRLPVVTGKAADKALAGLWEILQQAPELAPKVRAAQWTGQRRWSLWLAGGQKVLLPSAQPAAAFEQLAGWHLEHGLLDKPVEQIDLRIEGVAYLRTRHDEVDSPEAARALLTASTADAI